jgi:hypothetical protein
MALVGKVPIQMATSFATQFPSFHGGSKDTSGSKQEGINSPRSVPHFLGHSG